MKIFLGILLTIFLLTGCSSSKAKEPSHIFPSFPEQQESIKDEISVETDSKWKPDVPPPEKQDTAKTHPYLRELAASIAGELVSPEMREYEKTKAAFC